jgi:DNA repair exonuclease SbcCD nuclease subunit
MVKFAHMADVHLGGWKQKPLQDLNFKAFETAINKCISEKVEFVLIAGDLFDFPYPPIEVLKETFAQFRRLNNAKIPCFLIAGSHDYSVSGKTFLDVLEKAGFCKNVTNFEEKEEFLLLNPTIHKGIAIYGYPGRKSGLEVNDISKIRLNDSPGMFKIVMLHTTIDKAKGTIPIPSVEIDKLPKADYYALGHLHIDFQHENFVYSGPLFPNNFAEFEDLAQGSFYIIDTELPNPLKKISIKLRETEPVEIEVRDAISATDKILAELNKRNLENKIVLLRVRGNLENGKISDIKFSDVEDYVIRRKAYALLRNTHDLKVKEVKLEIEIEESEDIEEKTISAYSDENPSDFNLLIPQLINSLNLEKQEGETNDAFANRLLTETKRIFKLK